MRQLALGGNHSLALTHAGTATDTGAGTAQESKGGRVLVFGRNHYGQCGVEESDVEDGNVHTPTPLRIKVDTHDDVSRAETEITSTSASTSTVIAAMPLFPPYSLPVASSSAPPLASRSGDSPHFRYCSFTFVAAGSDHSAVICTRVGIVVTDDVGAITVIFLPFLRFAFFPSPPFPSPSGLALHLWSRCRRPVWSRRYLTFTSTQRSSPPHSGDLRPGGARAAGAETGPL